MLTKIYSCQITTCSSRLSFILTTFLIFTWKIGFSDSSISDLFSTKNPQFIYTECCSFTFRDLILIQGCVSQTVFTFDDSWLWRMYIYCMIIKKVDIYGRDLWQHNCSHVYSYVLTSMECCFKKGIQFLWCCHFWSICKTLDTMAEINMSTSINSTSQVITIFLSG